MHFIVPKFCAAGGLAHRLLKWLTPDLPQGMLRFHAGVEFVVRQPSRFERAGTDWSSPSYGGRPKHSGPGLKAPYKRKHRYVT